MALTKLAILAVPLLLAGPALAEEAQDFYRNRTLTLVVGHEAGTGYDLYGRTLARHIGRHIPGEPGLVVQNMPGAGGLNAANWLFNVAPRDGSVIMLVAADPLFEPLFGGSTARLDPVGFTWIGNLDESPATCDVAAASGIAKVEDLLARDAVFGATGATSAVSTFAVGLKSLLGARLKIVQGYKGTADIKLALERGEIAGACGMSLSTLKTQWKDAIAAGSIRTILQFGPQRHAELAQVPTIYEFAHSDDDRAVFDLAFGRHILGRPVMAPPAVPPARAAALRQAFAATVQDAQFLAETGKLGLPVDASSGEAVTAMIRKFFAYPKPLVERAAAAIKEK
jgi:tripartite-type tricarboxylate transporter receptor subunit TctC